MQPPFQLWHGDNFGLRVRRSPTVAVVASLLAVVLFAAGSPPVEAASVRTLVYHQISSVTTTINEGGPGGQASPIVSADGQRIAFSQPPTGGDPATHIFRTNFDGSGQVEVDAYTPLCCGTLVDISGDGARIISGNGEELRIANGDGSGALPLIALDDIDLGAIAIAGDGSKVFFIVARDRCIRNSSPCIPVQRGIWVIDGSGSGLRQIVGPAQLEALGIPAPALFGVPVLGVSADGGHIVFGAFHGPVLPGGFGQGLFAVNLNGSGLHDLLGRVGFVTHAGISGDGAKVFYEIRTPDDPIHDEIGVLDFAGSGQLKLADSRDFCCGITIFPASDDRAQLSADGSRLLLGSGNRAVVVNTDGTGLLQLAIRTPGSDALFALLYDTLSRVTMDGSATRFVYFALPFAQPKQLATLEINPPSVGVAPSITSPSLVPPFILTASRSAATLSAHVSAADPLLTVGNTVLANGVDDPNVTHQILVDNGTNGDVTPGDGTFTSNAIFTNCCATVGPRTVRVQSGVQRADNRLHATAVDIAPFAVVLSPIVPLEDVRTLVYHQIGSVTTTINEGGPGGQASPIVSADGQRIAFSRPPTGGDPATHIFRTNFDGSGQVEVDAYTPLCCGTLVDISGDGARIISGNGEELRIANGDGSGALPLIALDDIDLGAIAISGDGSKVFFIVARDRCIRNSSPCIPVQRGIWVIDGSGSGLRQIVGPAQLEALGIPAPAQFGVPVLGVSADGGHIVFGAFHGPVLPGGFGQGLFAVNLNGSGLHDLLGRVGFVTHAGISGDGAKVFYEIRTPDDPIHDEIGVLDFAGSGQLKLADSRDFCCGITIFPASDDRAQLSADGSRLLLGSGNRAVVVNTDGTGLLQLAIRTPGSDALFALLYDTLSRVTMDGSATRFVYFALPFAQPKQLATLEINPPSVGVAPSITSPSLVPPFILTASRSAATLSAHVSAADPLLTVGNTVLANGVDDPNVTHQILVDNGTNGDVTPGDGTFTSNAIFTNCCATVGPRTVRVQSGVQRADNRLHATAVAITPFAVVDAIAPVLASAASRKVHGAAGTFDLPLSLVPTNPTTEPRQGPAQTIVFTFDKPITSADVAVTEGTATPGPATFSGSDVVVGLTGVTNQQYVTVTLTNVSSSDGATGGSGSIRIGFLLGDVNQNRVVSVADLGLVNAQLAQQVTATNYLKDVNASGTLTVGDKGITNANLTKALPAP